MAERKREWDMTIESGLASAVRWLQKKSGALLVAAVRVDDLAIAADPQLAPRDVLTLLEDRQPALHEQLQAARREAQAKVDRQRDRGTR